MFLRRSMLALGRVLAVVGLVLGLSAGAASAQESDESVRTVYLVRHGHYHTEDPADAEVGKGLTTLGIAQARLVGDRLRALPVDITSLRASSMTRARQTAAVIGEGFPDLEVAVTRSLRECTPSTWREDIMEDLEPGEAEACEARLDSVFAATFVPVTGGDSYEIIVAHGNVTRYLVTRALGVDPLSWLGMSVGHCSITQFRITSNGRIKVLSVGDVGHIPPNLQSGLFTNAPPLEVPGG